MLEDSLDATERGRKSAKPDVIAQYLARLDGADIKSDHSAKAG